MPIASRCTPPCIDRRAADAGTRPAPGPETQVISLPIWSAVLLAVFGLAAGVGITAVGPGGVLATVGLFTLTGLSPAHVAGTALVTHVATGTLGTAAYIRSGELRDPETRRVTAILAAAACLGAPLARPSTPWSTHARSAPCSADSALLTCVLMWRRNRRLPGASEPRRASRPCRWRSSAWPSAPRVRDVGIGGPMLMVPSLVALGAPDPDRARRRPSTIHRGRRHWQPRLPHPQRDQLAAGRARRHTRAVRRPRGLGNRPSGPHPHPQRIADRRSPLRRPVLSAPRTINPRTSHTATDHNRARRTRDRRLQSAAARSKRIWRFGQPFAAPVVIGRQVRLVDIAVLPVVTGGASAGCSGGERWGQQRLRGFDPSDASPPVRSQLATERDCCSSLAWSTARPTASCRIAAEAAHRDALGTPSWVA